jgi:hypothetical protein
MKMKFEKKDVIGDGNCLFRSLGIALNEKHDVLRRMVCDYIRINFNKRVRDTSIKQWIKFESDMNVKDYVNKMSKDGEWGGAIEIMVITKIFNINIFVVEQKSSGKGYKMISSFISNQKNRNIFLVYSGSHYSFLVVKENTTDIKT